MRKKVLTSISLLPFMLFAQETPWDSILWGNGNGKPATAESSGKGWILPVLLAPVAATAAILLWPSKEIDPDDPCPLKVIPNISPATCASSNGMGSIILSDSTVPQVTWPDGLVASSRDNLHSGTYLLEISYGSCIETYTLEIPFINIQVPLLLLELTPPSGSGTPDGSFVAAVDPPGNGPYVFTLNGQDPLTTEEPFFFANGLVAGTYLLEVTDAKGCNGTLTVDLQVRDYTPDKDKELVRILSKRRPWHLKFVFTPLFILPTPSVRGGR